MSGISKCVPVWRLYSVLIANLFKLIAIKNSFWLRDCWPHRISTCFLLSVAVFHREKLMWNWWALLLFPGVFFFFLSIAIHQLFIKLQSFENSILHYFPRMKINTIKKFFLCSLLAMVHSWRRYCKGIMEENSYYCHWKKLPLNLYFFSVRCCSACFPQCAAEELSP